MNPQVKVKPLVVFRHPVDALPTYARRGDSGADLRAIMSGTVPARGRALFPTGIAMELPEGYELQVRGRSGLALSGILAHWGTVDTGYRGQVGVLLFNTTDHDYHVKSGDKIGQAVVARVEQAAFELAADLSGSERGTEGYGSTGR